MKIRRVVLRPLRLTLEQPVVTAAGRIEERDGMLVSLETTGGQTGFGESTPIAGFGMETFEESREALMALAPRLAGADLDELDSLLDEIDAAAPSAPSARSAVDAALHDAAARVSGRSVAALLAARAGRRPRAGVPVSALLTGATPRALETCAVKAAAAGFGTVKLKVAARSVGEDEARVRAVRTAVGSGIRIRIDANGGWKEEEALEALSRLARWKIELVEQPIGAEDLAGLARFRSRSPIRIAADESAAGAAQAERVIALGAADAICLKLGACGGLRSALRIAESAHRAGMDVFVTSALDGFVARAAALHLAAALPGSLPACGLATGSLLGDDLGRDPEPIGGDFVLPRATGLGADPDPAALARLSSGPDIVFAAGHP